MKTHYLFMMITEQLGGAEYRLMDYCKHINYQTYRVTLGVKKDLFSEPLNSSGIKVEIALLPVINGQAGMYARFREYYRFFKKIQPEAIIFSQFWLSSFSLPELIAGYIVAKGQVYMIVHDNTVLFPKYKSRLHFGFIPGIGFKWRQERFLQKALIHFTKKVLVVSQAAKSILETVYRYPADKVKVAYLGIDPDRFSPNIARGRELRRLWGIPDNDRIIISASRIDEVKRFDRLLEAFDTIAKKRADIWLVIAGKGPKLQATMDLVKTLDSGVQKRIKFLGFVEDSAPLLQAGDIFILASDSEGFPRAVLEALGTGLIVVATDCGGTAEIVQDKVNGFLVEKSVSGVISGLDKALTLNDEEKTKMTVKAREYIKEKGILKNNINYSLSILGIKND